MTVTLNRDEGGEEPGRTGAVVGAASKRESAAKATTKPRSNADCLASSGARGGGGDGDVAIGAAKRSRTDAAGVAPGSAVAGVAGQTASGASARRFLRRYHHHVAFRRLVSSTFRSRSFFSALVVFAARHLFRPCFLVAALGRRSMSSGACCTRFYFLD